MEWHSPPSVTSARAHSGGLRVQPLMDPFQKALAKTLGHRSRQAVTDLPVIHLDHRQHLPRRLRQQGLHVSPKARSTVVSQTALPIFTS